MNIDDLYFGVMLKDFNNKKMTSYNLFNLSTIKWSVARYRTMTKQEKEELTNPLHFCFGDVWSRCEYEMIISQFPFKDAEDLINTGEKVDLYSLYVEPNERLLMDMVDKISLKSAKAYLKEWNDKKKRQ